MGPVSTIMLDKKLFSDHLPFWRQLIDLDQGQRMVLWASLQRQAYREIGMDYAWDSDQPVPVLPSKEVQESMESIAEAVGHYL